MNRTVILAAATDAGQSTKFEVHGRYPVTVIVHAAAGLSASQHADLQISHDGGSTWQDLYEDGTQIRLNNTNRAVSIYGPGLYRVDKDATTNATGVTLLSKAV